jgi:wyosine [tRNA(Phe)-imidazoG37] synthetase (radical SAM superfamily)
MYTYGPVPSRRLGRSLGVSPIPPKTCSYTCVYCQLGRTTHLQTTRESFYPKEDLLAEIIKRGKTSAPDYVTFVGDGEPILCKDLGWLIRQTREQLELPTAVITNGSLLFRKDVRQDLKDADVIMPTLDAGNEKAFRAVNRPHRSIAFDTMLQGLIDFRHGYHGQIWLEVMLVKGLNDTKEELLSIRQAVDAFEPDRVYVVTPIRPPAEPWVEPPLPETILMAQELIGKAVSIGGLETGRFGLQGFTNARQAILETGSRHPLRRDQAAEIERSFGDSGVIDRMLQDRELVQTTYKGETFLLPGHFIRGEKTHKVDRRL